MPSKPQGNKSQETSIMQNATKQTAKAGAVLFAGVALMLTGVAQGSALIMAAPVIVLMLVICVKG